MTEPLPRTTIPRLERQIVLADNSTNDCWSPFTKTGFRRWAIGTIIIGLIFLLFFLLSLFLEWAPGFTITAGLITFIALVFSIVGLIWFEPDEDCAK
jgi:hypothetical protein